MGLGPARKRKQLGRPKRLFDQEKAQAMLQAMSAREVAKQLDVSRGVIARLHLF